MEIRLQRCASGVGLLLPTRAKQDDAGLDLRSTIDTSIFPLDRAVIPTGFSWEIPPGFFGLIRPRSGLAVSHGIDVLAGVVDSGYRDEIKVVLINMGEEQVKIQHGDRIAQMIIIPICIWDITESVDQLSESDRGLSGFGSTGRR